MISFVIAALAPAMALFSYVYLRDSFSRGAMFLVLRIFIIGALLVLPISVIQFALTEEEMITEPFVKAFLLYGLIEEGLKWLMLFIFAYQHGQLRQPLDGIVFGVALSLGFATVENSLYMIAYGFDHVLPRTLLPTTAHAVYGIVMGYYIGRAKYHRSKRLLFLGFAAVLPMILHGSYDYILMDFGHYFLLLMIPFMVGLWLLAIWKIKKANKLNENEKSQMD
ncbi:MULTISPECIES: glutamic-type intramembrane protease PrsW [Shouchella]|uniref:Protease PrsW n=3 Tax=Bacillaceae TaxID=186817 RepID=A0A060M264_9BACI|nr:MULTISPECIES: glutamic-type intramembrane protease PrsW [Shouchella]KQL51942.1 protease [Alkalicoccobacillus plakortidis]RQW20499.1 PrsW family intramembrane metalloprotease [Bacillus sp. C1-1]AIC94633.1 peptidase PrsW [Shouchella lehensis G1]MBG9784724.1 protease [Shouchella lehensis]TES50515.1 intramembrane metalloprotease PrsW [Shouchella lehensis]